MEKRQLKQNPSKAAPQTSIEAAAHLPTNLINCLNIWEALKAADEAEESLQSEIIDQLATIILENAPTAEA